MTKLNQNEKNALSVALWNYGQDFCNPYDFKEKEDIEQTQNELEQSNLTFSKSQYNDFADTIYTALQSGFTEDEEAIYTVFKRLKNNDDFKQLKLSYGSRLIGLYGFRVSMNLTKSIRSLLNDDECKHINYIMSNRGLTTRI